MAGGADPVTPAMIGAEAAGTAANLVAQHGADPGAHAALLAAKADRSYLQEITLAAAAWSGQTAPYSLTLELAGVAADTLVELLPGAAVTAVQLDALQSANIQGGAQGNGSLTLLAFGEKPAADLPVRLVVRGDL